jgi:hypothetical protein
MTSKRKRGKTIPTHIDLPLGFHVTVRYLSKAAFLEKNGCCDAAWWHEDEGEEEGGVIDLVKGDAPTKQRRNFLHELEHCLVDYREFLRARL